MKKQHCIAERHEKNADASSSTLLGHSYWYRFMHQYGHKIKVKRGVKLNKNRDDWCTYLNFNTMYNNIYSLMAETGIAAKLDTAHYFNKSGQIVESEGEACGRKSKYMLVLPEKFFFVDEVSSNTSHTLNNFTPIIFAYIRVTCLIGVT